MNINKLFEQFNSKTILVLGDLMVDEYYEGNVTRISPEAPVPIVSVTNHDRRLGGAANVALNLINLGAKTMICGVRGNDENGEWMANRLKEMDINNAGLLVDLGRPTTVKTRIIGNRHQMLRVDREDSSEVGLTIEKQIIDYVKQIINQVDVLIFQDYNKGLLTKKIISSVIKICNQQGVATLVDPKRDHFLDYKGVTLFKPNRKEIVDGLKLHTELSTKTEIEAAVKTLSEKLETSHILLTLSEMGVCILHNNQIDFIEAHPRKIIDVSGAGDSVISVAALAVACGLDWKNVAAMSNLAGGLVCEKVGVVAIDKEVLKREVNNLFGI
ncbi:MAG: D-glycero-beta-D-manno-heptose-7-phosphate kinase [Flavobacteriales bacterium]|nr:D-glycero-beta-D-manno-heptose-7-phosphate kinase [Flavobacteriales bacterium]